MSDFKFNVKMKFRCVVEEFKRKYIPFGKDFRCKIYSLIGHHYFAKNGHKHSETKKTLELIGISSVWYRRGYLYIKAARPGILIGKRGADVDSLGEYIRACWFLKFPFKGIRLVEDKEISYFYNYIFSYESNQESEDVSYQHWTDFDD